MSRANKSSIGTDIVQQVNEAVESAEKLIVRTKVWFYNMTGISLITSKDINNGDCYEYGKEEYSSDMGENKLDTK